MHLGVLVFVVDLRAAGRFDFQRFNKIFDLVGKSPGFEREVARRFFAGIKMLVEPPCRRHEQAAGLPVDALAWFPWLP